MELYSDSEEMEAAVKVVQAAVIEVILIHLLTRARLFKTNDFVVVFPFS